MKNLVIHIGLPRTGTTFLQKNVFPNIENVHFLHRGVPSNIRNIVSYKVLEGKVNLVSDELYTINNFSSTNEVGPFVVADRIYKIFPDAKIILVIREKEDWKRSLYNQYLKSKPSYISFEEWESDILFDFDFKKYEIYLKKFFKEVLVLHYEDMKKEQKRFIKDLCNFIGCKVPEHTTGVINKSLSKRQLKFMRRVKNLEVPNCLKKFLAELLRHIFDII